MNVQVAQFVVHHVVEIFCLTYCLQFARHQKVQQHIFTFVSLGWRKR